MSSDEKQEGHEHQTVVICQGIDDPEDVLIYGPFEDSTWAQAWIKQHHHDTMLDEENNELSEEEQNRRIEDEDHFCNFGPDSSHYIQGMWVPGFDPTTLPVQE